MAACGSAELDRNRRSRKLFDTTKTLDSAIAAPAITGVSKPRAASGSAAKDALKVGVGRCQATAEACPVLDGHVRRDRRHLGVARAGRASGLRPSSPSEPSLPNDGCPHVSPSSL